MTQKSIPWITLVAAVVAPALLSARAQAQESQSDRTPSASSAHRRSMSGTLKQLEQIVNDHAAVKNQCESRGQEFRVEEASRISEINGCNLTLITRKTTNSISGQQHVEFTLNANLADLTTPASVQTQSFSQCKPLVGAVVKVMSRAAPGKTVRTTRREGDAGQTSAEMRRADLSLFFPDLEEAQKAARFLDQAVKKCGGKEWPDEDDLP